MSARRQASTTSLSRYARAGSPDFTNRSLDFCNAFWGLGDGGVEVLFARMRGAMRTMEELKNYWKERASIEEQYAKRLASLAKITLGKDEIGELRISLDTLKQETDKQAQAHLVVASAIKSDLEGSASAFMAKQQQHKRGIQTQIEKEFKNKQTQEGYVARAREKYETDCMRINSYTAQSTIIQGKDLEKVQMRLERAQQTVQANQRDYANFARVLQDTTQKWEQGWKAFCDSCQDLEEERVEFMKDNMWAYANAVSTVCVSDDESCEKLRLALEQLEVDRDMENFVRDYGTGTAIPDPPPFIDYSKPDAQPASSQRPTTHISSFTRQSQRSRQPMMQAQGPPEPEPEPVDMTGIGSVGTRTGDPPQRSQTQSRASTRGQEFAQPNGVVANGRMTPSVGIRPTDPQADPIDPTARTMIRVGPNVYEVNPENDPQPAATSRPASPNPPTNVFMKPPSQNGPPGSSSGVSVQNVLSDYQQSLPGERKSISRSNSRSNSISGPQGSSMRDRPLSSESGRAGIGAQGRSPSPQPFAPPSRSVSPAMQGPPASNRNSYSRPPANGPPAGHGHAYSGSTTRQGSISIPQQPAHQQRPTSPGIGIQLDPNGRVVADDMATMYRPSPQGPPSQPIAQYGAPPPQTGPPSQPGQMHRRPSHNAGPNGAPYGAPQQYGAGAAPGYNAVPQQQPQPQYAPAPVQQQQPTYGGLPQQPYGQGQYSQQQQPQGYAPPPGGALVPRGPPVNGGYYPPPQQPQSQPQGQYRPPSPRAPSPQPPANQPPPTGQYTDDGRGVLFYVKAMYNYRATIEEEFDFQEGDIIAVTATPEDGWWSGELLDETRRQPGRHIFPSNFVCLF